MFICPRCGGSLARVQNEHGVHFACPRCQGRVVGLGVLHRTALADAVHALWRATAEHPRSTDTLCPVCHKAMLAAPVPAGADPLEVDVCRRCQMVWFDVGEQEALPLAEPPPEESELPQKARIVLALHRVEELAREAERTEAFDREPPDAWWKYIPALFGLPVEQETDALARWPLVTWTVAALLVLVGLFGMGREDDLARLFGFVAARPLRLGGATLLTCFFVHGGPLHWLTNVYFLLMMGDNVEDLVGRRRFIALLATATLLGALAHALFDPRAAIPLVGASGGISGVIVFYSLRFPHARLGIFLRRYARVGWLTMPAWVAFALWLLLQVAASSQQFSGMGHVSSLAHLGGVVAGLWLWLAWRDV